MKIDILTLFPEQIENFTQHGIFRIAQERNEKHENNEAHPVEIKAHNLRNWTTDKHKTVDDKPYGGGAGMVLKVDVVYNALQDLKTEDSKVIAFVPSGKTLTQKTLQQFADEESKNETHLILLCGHYEGFDYRIIEHLVDYEISIGDYVLSGGEIPALLLVDGIVRLLPGVLGNPDSPINESFGQDGLLEHPHYTRPEEFEGWKVPDVLLSGNHAEIEEWRKKETIKITKKNRPDLLP